MGLRIEADRNMSCQGGVGVDEVELLVFEFGSVYATSSMFQFQFQFQFQFLS